MLWLLEGQDFTLGEGGRLPAPAPKQWYSELSVHTALGKLLLTRTDFILLIGTLVLIGIRFTFLTSVRNLFFKAILSSADTLLLLVGALFGGTD